MLAASAHSETGHPAEHLTSGKGRKGEEAAVARLQVSLE